MTSLQLIDNRLIHSKSVLHCRLNDRKASSLWSPVLRHQKLPGSN